MAEMFLTDYGCWFETACRYLLFSAAISIAAERLRNIYFVREQLVFFLNLASDDSYNYKTTIK